MFIQEEIHFNCDYVLIPGVVDAASGGSIAHSYPHYNSACNIDYTFTFEDDEGGLKSQEMQHAMSYHQIGGEVCSTPPPPLPFLTAAPSVNSDGDRLEACQLLHALNQKAVKQNQRLTECTNTKNLERWFSSNERAEIYDWLVFFALERKRTFIVNGEEFDRCISESSAQLAVEYLDRFFTQYNRQYPGQHSLIMLCMASFRLACKYNENDDLSPTADELIDYSTQTNISPKDVDQCELILLEALCWELGDVVPCSLASTYYRYIREFGIASLTLVDMWEESVQRTTQFLQYKYSTSNLMHTTNTLFTCACILLSRLITLHEMHPSVDNKQPTDMITILGEDHCWPSCWGDLLGFQLEDMKESLFRIQKLYLDEATAKADNTAQS